MKRHFLILAISAGLGSACEERSIADSFVDMLVARFDAPACQSANLLQGGGRKVGEDHLAYRIYTADDDCVNSLVKEMVETDFNFDGNAKYTATREKGWIERVSITPIEGGSGAKIEWEELNP